MVHTIWRRPKVKAETGYGDSLLYEQIKAGLFTRAVKIGPRAAGWPADEVEAIVAARIAGKTPDDIRVLVKRLHARRVEKLAIVQVGAAQ